MRVWSLPIVERSAARTGSDVAGRGSAHGELRSATDLRAGPAGTLYDLAAARPHELPGLTAATWLPVALLAPLLGALFASIPVTVMDGISTTLGWSTATEGSLWSRPFDAFHAVALGLLGLLTLLAVRLLLPVSRDRAVFRRVRAERGVDGATRLRVVPDPAWDRFLATLGEPAGSSPDPEPAAPGAADRTAPPHTPAVDAVQGPCLPPP